MYNLIELSPQIFSVEKIVINVFSQLSKIDHKKSDEILLSRILFMPIWDSSSLIFNSCKIITY